MFGLLLGGDRELFDGLKESFGDEAENEVEGVHEALLLAVG